MSTDIIDYPVVHAISAFPVRCFHKSKKSRRSANLFPEHNEKRSTDFFLHKIDPWKPDEMHCPGRFATYHINVTKDRYGVKHYSLWMGTWAKTIIMIKFSSKQTCKNKRVINSVFTYDDSATILCTSTGNFLFLFETDEDSLAFADLVTRCLDI